MGGSCSTWKTKQGELLNLLISYVQVGYRGGHVAVAGGKRLYWLYDITPLRRAEQAFGVTPAFYLIRAACRKELGQQYGADKSREPAPQASGMIALDHLLLAQAAPDTSESIVDRRLNLGALWCTH